MTQTNLTRGAGWSRIGTGAAVFVFALALLLSWASQRRLDALFDRADARKLDESARVLEHILAQQQKDLTASVGLLSEDARIRAMVLTPTFDQATVLDLLTDLKATSGATVVALLDGGGAVRVVVGAPEMDQLNLGTSSLVQRALEKPSAQPAAFANELGVLSAAPVRLDNQVRALFVMGFALDDAALERIQRDLGATGAVFVGDSIVASATRDPELEKALRAAAEQPQGTYQVVADAFLANSSRIGDAASARVAWLVPRYRHADEVKLTRALAWLPAVLVGLLLALLVGFVWSQSRAGNL